MKSTVTTAILVLTTLSSSAALPGSEPAIMPVTPNAMPEAVALLKTLQAISGRYTLTGQANFIATGDTNSRFAAGYTGKVPAVWTSDFGFAAEGDTDSYLARPEMVREAIRQHRMGAIVSLCWHAVPPTADEPVTFRPLPGSDPSSLQSVQGRLLDEQFKDILTPGTVLYERWVAQVDAIAVFLRQLQEARVPVLWRPYHEMNGDWFWWGGRTEGEYTTAALYRQIFDRLVNHHLLKNLIWTWSVDRVSDLPQREHAKYFPGIDYVDILSLDVYGRDFAQSYYDSLVTLSQGKPLALAEVGNPPSLEIRESQPLWTYYATWVGMVRNTTKREYRELLEDPRVLGMNDAAFVEAMASYREACGLPPVHVSVPQSSFSGTWVLNEEQSIFGRMGAGFAPARLTITHEDNALTVLTTRIVEYAPDQVTEQRINLDGTESKSMFRDFPLTTKAEMKPDGAISMEIVAEVPFGPPGTKRTVHETWTLVNLGDQLSVRRISPSFIGPGNMEETFLFDRR